MDSGFSTRVLLLFVVLGHYAVANVYRYSDGGVQPYMERAFARSHKPASSSESYSKQSGSSESSRPSHGPSGAYGRQVDGYSHQGSVPNYRPASTVSKFRQTSPQSNVHHSQAFDDGNKFRSGIVSSGAIEFRDSVKPSKQQSKPSAPVLQHKRGMWEIPSKPSGAGVGSGKVLSHLSEVQPSKPSQTNPNSDPSIKWDDSYASRPWSYNLNKQMPGSRPVSEYYTVRPQSSRLTSQMLKQTSSPAKPPQQSAPGGHVKSTAGMWDIPKPISGEKHRLSFAHPATETNPTPKPFQKQAGSLTPRGQQLRGSVWDNTPASSRWMDVKVQTPKSVPVASLYNYEGQRPQLRSMYNRNRQSAH